MNDTPELRLRARHRLCQSCNFAGHWSMAGEPHCYHCWESWPCDVIAALDKLEHDATITMWHGAAVLERAGFTVTGLEAENVRLRERADALADALENMYSGVRYIQQGQGLFPGSWWERAITKVKDALSAYREVGRANGEER